MTPEFIHLFLQIITIFVLAIYLGVELINKVPSLLHTPLMSGSNAISGISVVGAILAVGLSEKITDPGMKLITLIFAGAALAFASVNVAGGFLVTHRMLDKFKPRKK